MANLTKLKDQIRSTIKSNGKQDITGNILQDQMISMVDQINESFTDELNDLEEEVLKLKIKIESGVGGEGEGGGGGGLIIVDDKEILDALEVPKGTIASVATETEIETEKPLAELYDFIADGGDPKGEVDYDILPRMIDVAITFPNTTWHEGRVLIGREGGNSSLRYFLVVDATRVRFAYGLGEILLLAENNGETIEVYDDAVAQMHDILRDVDGLRYMGIQAGSIEDLSQFFAIIQKGIEADAYILGETWQRLMKETDEAEVPDLSDYVTKTELENTVNSINEEIKTKVDDEYVNNAIAGVKTQIIHHYPDTIEAALPNTCYILSGEGINPVFTIASFVNGNEAVAKYTFMFTLYTKVVLPSNVLWVDGQEPTIASNKHYELSIVATTYANASTPIYKAILAEF